jgi:hypothetical protein
MSDFTITVTPGTVEAIQGTPVSAITPTDGYVLTYVSADGEWEPKSAVGLQSQIFTSNGTWTCPTNVYNVILTGFGGGGGGAGGKNNSYGGGGGGGALPGCSIAPVTPGNTYSITIGGGGAGGAANADGSPGQPTQFGTIFQVLGAGQGFAYNNITFNGGGNYNGCTTELDPSSAAFGGSASVNGFSNYLCNGLYSGGNATTSGGGGGAGPGGNGGDGGMTNIGSNGINGSNATNNSGAGGGGGGGNTTGTTTATGGNGGSGQLTVAWIGF